MTAPSVLNGPETGTSSLGYVEPVRVATLTPGNVVILDNLPAHRGSAARGDRSGRSHLLFLPPYSHDLNPTQNAF